MQQKPERLALTMWDFSWLTRREGHEAEYADFDDVLDELVDRGYNCVRIDAFPHLVARGSDGELVERFTILPEPFSAQWGNSTPVNVDPWSDIAWHRDLTGRIRAAD